MTQFRAEWTDQTPAQNVASYTLEVSTKPTYELLETADFSDVPDAVDDGYLYDVSDNPSGFIPEGWSATYFLTGYDGGLILAFGGTIKTLTYNLTGYDKVTVVVRAATYGNNSVMRVSTSAGNQEISLGSDFDSYTIVLDCADYDAVTFTDIENYVYIKHIDVYAGDLSAADLRATEEGNATYRLITEITDRFYTVENLETEGTYIYKVKTVFRDGTESAWSNVEEVTLFENGHGYELGDVNHDRSVTISDVTALIDMLLSGGDSVYCPICADVDGMNGVTIADVTALIDMLLSGN